MLTFLVFLPQFFFFFFVIRVKKKTSPQFLRILVLLLNPHDFSINAKRIDKR